MYRMFYNRDIGGDVLFILMEPERKPTREETKGSVTALYDGDDLVGINIADLSKILKIRAKGMIFTPGEELVDVVNHIIRRAGLPKLAYCTDSGYRVATVTSVQKSANQGYIIKMNNGDENLTTVTDYSNIKAGDQIVIAIDGTIQYDGKTFKKHLVGNEPVECHICEAKELRIESDDLGAFIVDGYKPGDDFYLAGE